MKLYRDVLERPQGLSEKRNPRILFVWWKERWGYAKNTWGMGKKKKKNWVLLTDSTRTEQSGFGGWEGGQAARSDSCPTASWIVGERWQLCWELLGMFSTRCQASAWAASERNLRKWWASASLWSRHLAVGEPGGRKAATRARAPFHLCGWRGRCSIVNGAASETRNLSRPLTSCVLWAGYLTLPCFFWFSIYS